uniref:Cullin-5 n=1 Tax=Syphacia muris TaxID=451379 RepID=A0A0N5AXF5_9BILA
MLGNENRYSFEKEWEEARETVVMLLNQQNVSKLRWQELFSIIHHIATWIENGTELVRDKLDQEIHIYVVGASERIQCHHEENAMLRAYIDEWQKFFSQTEHLPKPFSFIYSSHSNHSSLSRPNRNKNHSSEVTMIMLHEWNRIIFENVKDKLQAAAMRLIESERNGRAFDPQLVIGVRQSYVSLNLDDVEPLAVYKSNFEHVYIETTKKYYKARAAQVLEANGVQKYMVYADTKLEEEKNRGLRYLESSSDSLKKVLDNCINVLVVQFQEQMLAECPAMISNNQVEKLRMLYRLLNGTPEGIKSVLRYLGDYIKSEAMQDMKANASTITTDSEKYINQLLSMFSRFSRLVKDAFDNDSRFLTERDKAFQEVVNDTCIFKMEISNSRLKGTRMQAESRCPELLASYCDLLLRKTSLSKRLSSDEIDSRLNDVLLVLKYVNNKDVFMRFHKAHLARRLILEMSADQEKEEHMVTRMRDAGMPADLVNKLFRMLQDIEINKDLNSTFKNSIGFNNNLMADTISLKILNAGAWARGNERVQLQVPRELEDVIPEVEEFYRKQHSGRKLQWLYHWSHGTITFTNALGKFDLDVTTLQYSVLNCWNDRPYEKLSFESIRIATQLPNAELTRTLFSLIGFPKLQLQVLCSDCETANPRSFTDSTLFWINQGFAIVKNNKKQNRGRLSLIGRLQLSTESNNQAEHDDIIALRLMKMRKRCKSAQLQTELIELLKHMFLPSKRLIKEQIEWLIENRFISRDENDLNTFVYVS